MECLVGLESVDIVHVFIPKKSPKLIELCENNNYDFTFVKNINEQYQLISKMYFDLFVVMGHQFLLKEDLLRLGDGIGFHPSMLPRRRGRAPINWAIIDGLEEMGVSLFYLDKGVD
ncbi:MAG: formyltransferase family protein, partial [Candidatus Thermoplasmatota archaeon]|nr:formyltransferase family protein [Candidatus Thermoplasmatota archaeon]